MSPPSALLLPPLLPLLCALAVCALSAALWLTSPRARAASVPGPREYPLIGALPWLLTHRRSLLAELAARSIAAGGRTWSVAWLLSPRYHFITSPPLLAHVLRDKFELYEKGHFVAGKLGQLLGAGIFVTDGPAWEEQRKRASHMFSERSFHEHIFASLAGPFAALELALAAAAASGARLDLHALMHRFTLDAIGAVAFGDSVGALADAGAPFAAAFDGVQARVEARFFDPLWPLTEALSGGGAAIARGVAALDAYCAALIARRRAAGDAAARSDLLSRAIAAGGAGASDAALRDLVLNFVIAGRDTTAQALSWTLACLAGGGARGSAAIAAPPAVLAALTEEARRVLGAAPVQVAAGVPYAAAKGLRYATAVLRETLRLFPSVPKDVKMAVADDVLPDGTAVRAGDVVAYLPYAMGRLECNWPRPLDYDPQRFLGETQPSPFLHIAFNAGRRTCLGQTLALTEGAVVLALIARSYEVTLEPGQVLLPAETLTLPMRDGLWATLRVKAP